jgi:hypothetical protein
MEFRLEGFEVDEAFFEGDDIGGERDFNLKDAIGEAFYMGMGVYFYGDLGEISHGVETSYNFRGFIVLTINNSTKEEIR